MTQEDQEPLRWGVVGASVISRQMVADFALVPGATVSAVASRDAARAAAFAEEFGIAASYSRRHDMFAADIEPCTSQRRTSRTSTSPPRRSRPESTCCARSRSE